MIQRNERIYSIQPIKEWMEKRRREWDEHVTRMDAERDNIPAGRCPGRPLKNGAT